MISVKLQGGLGNQLFQIAAGCHKAYQSMRAFRIISSVPTPHSSQDYFASILQKWRSFLGDEPSGSQPIHETSFVYTDAPTSPPELTLYGYFQNYRYVPSDFCASLVLPPVDRRPGAFLHIRGGDYVGHPLHDVGLDAYYMRAVSLFPQGTHFYVFTNDIAYAKTRPIFASISHSFVHEPNEVTCLALMAACSLGGICANSTFSWWGAYLNRYARTLVLPSKWFNDDRISIEGYFFPGSIKCQV